jgi:beta-mannosidase
MGRLAGHENTSGDMHYWGVWHGQHPFSDFRKYRSRFMSEYGFQSFPELQTVATYAMPDEWDIESEVMAHHQRSGIGNLRIRQYMGDDYRIPEDFEHFLYVSQLLQAEGIKMAIQSHRVEMPYCMGSLYWQLNDCWPVASWSGIDYYGKWKALHYFVKDAFKETILAAFHEDDRVKVWAVTDSQSPSNCMLSLKLMDFEGKVLWSEEKAVSLKAGQSIKVFEAASEQFYQIADPAESLLKVDLENEEGILLDTEILYLVKPKDLKLSPDPRLKFQVIEGNDHFEISLSSASLVKNVFLTTMATNHHFSDNGFDLLPGEQRKVNIPKKVGIEDFKEQLKVLMLNETMGSVGN